MTTKGIFLVFLVFHFTTSLFSQETTKPLTDTEIERNVSRLDIEGKEYKNVKVTFKSISPDYYFSDKHKVKVTIVDMDDKKVWKKTLKNTFLYVNFFCNWRFGNGRIICFSFNVFSWIDIS